jgi:hypothetical protein
LFGSKFKVSRGNSSRKNPNKSQDISSSKKPKLDSFYHEDVYNPQQKLQFDHSFVQEENNFFSYYDKKEDEEKIKI